MRMIISAAALVLAAACTPSAQPTASANACQASASEQWAPGGGEALSIEAHSAGPDCAHAVATITVRDVSNEVVWTDVHVTAQVMVLAGAQDSASMQSALHEWIASDHPSFATSAALPDWPQGAEQPAAGEFAFYVDESLDRANYVALRSRGVPVYCYVQGMESLNCLALENGIMTPIGVQTFPG